MKKKILTVCCAAFLFLAALALTLYPLISNWYNTKHQSEIHTQYQEVIEQVDNSKILEARELAEAYNKTLQPGAQLGDVFTKETIQAASDSYEELLNLAGDGTMGYIQIPLIGVDLPILHGTTTETLDAGAGHLLGSSLPIGGEDTHAVITAHTGMASQKMFSDLDKLKEGDVFYLQVLDETLAYQVDAINIVLPHETALLGISEGEDLCTLITCTPFAINSHRLLVRGHRIPYEEAEEIVEEQITLEEVPESTWEQQYFKGLYIGIGTVGLVSILLLVVEHIRRKHHEAH